MQAGRISLIVHGGAGPFRQETAEAGRAALQQALERGWAILQAGGRALDACEEAIMLLEDEPVFDAGIGAYLNRDGRVQLDAILMDGASLEAGAAAAVERVRNPIRLARRILEHSEHILLAGAGAEQFAVEQGMSLCDPAELITPEQRQRWLLHTGRAEAAGTVGAVARDSAGNLAAGTSTGGTFFKYPGRVGDSPLIGCGCYADNEAGAASCTGHGESIMKVVLAKTCVDLAVSGHSAQAAADEAIRILRQRTDGGAGLIFIDGGGRVGVSFSTPHMAWAARSNDL